MQSFRRAEKKLGHEQDTGLLVKAVEELSQRECEAKLFEKKGIHLDPVSTRTSAAKVSEVKPLPAGKRVYIPQALQKAV